MGFISVDARDEERKDEVKKQWGDCELGRRRDREIESTECKKERGPKGDRVIGMFSHVSAREASISFISFRFFMSLCFSPCNNPCHLPGDSSETLGGRAPLGFMEYLPLRSITVHNDTCTRRNKRAGK